MNAKLSGTVPTNRSSTDPTPVRTRSVADVSDLTATAATAYAANATPDGDVYLERKGGRTFVVARSE